MPCCALRTCRNNSRRVNKSSGITFHRFPLQPHAREKWIKFVQLDRLDGLWLPSPYSTICSSHFREADKYLTKAGRLYLKQSAIPCVDPRPQNYDDSGTITPISVSVSDSESIFDSPRKIYLKRKLQEVTSAKTKLAVKINNIQRQNRNLKKKFESLTSLVKSLKKNFALDDIAEGNLIARSEAVELYMRFIKKNKHAKHIKYTPALRRFALTLHYYSPAAYKYVRQIYNKVLPHPQTLSRWYGTINAEPGFTNEAFEALKRKSEVNENPVVCTLIFDEMAIRTQRLFHKQEKLGAVNFGVGPQEGDGDEQVASQVLVFMLVSLTENWKLPVGYFLIAGINAEKKANLITICLQKCHDVGVKVVGLTFDGCRANLTAAEILGCKLDDLKNIQSHFPHPSTQEKVCIFLDPCHVIKLIRNTFEKRRLLFNKDGKEIRWQLLVNLNKLQQNEGLRFGNKLTPRHIHFRNQVMKVKLATQLLSMSVAKALILCDEVLKSTNFLDSSATVNFITLMNIFFDIMNSRKCHSYGFKRPIDERNKEDIFSFLGIVKSYIMELKYHVKSKRITKRKSLPPQIKLFISKKKIVETTGKTGFIGAIICIESLKTLYKDVVEEKKLMNYISTYRLSQDHLELFFGIIRKHGGYNYNPNVLQFRTAYKKTLNHLELRSSFTGNCIPLDNFSILSSSSTNIINSTSLFNKHDEKPYDVLPSTRVLNSDKEAEDICEILAKTLDNELVTSGAQLIVGYISGYITRILTKLLKCEECINSLTTTEKLPHHKLIIIKDMGGLCYSSEDVYKVCLTTETVIRKLIRESGGVSLAAKYNFSYITIKTLEFFIEKEVFSSLIPHSFDQPSTFNHRVHLIRAIINKYTKIRLTHEAKTDKAVTFTSKRQKLTKLILFQGK